MNEQILAFLAGAGLPVLLESLARIMPSQSRQRNPLTPSAQLPHRAGMRIEATPGGGPPQTTIAPSMIQAIMGQMQQNEQGPQQQPPTAALLQQLAQQRGVAM